MEKTQLIGILSEMLVPIGFKKKGSYWVINGDLITKMVNLQKSNYSSSFYINYGYILKSVPLGKLMMHVYYRVTSLDVEERKRIEFLLDIKSSIPDANRTMALKEILHRELVAKIQNINTEDDLLSELKKRPNLHDITSSVKNHFKLE